MRTTRQGRRVPDTIAGCVAVALALFALNAPAAAHHQLRVVRRQPADAHPLIPDRPRFLALDDQVSRAQKRHRKPRQLLPAVQLLSDATLSSRRREQRRFGNLRAVPRRFSDRRCPRPAAGRFRQPAAAAPFRRTSKAATGSLRRRENAAQRDRIVPATHVATRLTRGVATPYVPPNCAGRWPRFTGHHLELIGPCALPVH